MSHFLLVYDRSSGELVRLQEFTDYDAALSERFHLERVRTSPAHEIVVLTSESRENLERTHVRYFKSVEEQLRAAVGG